MSKFKASDYASYNSRFGFDKYKYLYNLMSEIFSLLPFDEKYYEDDISFQFKGMNVFIDKKFGSYCEIINTSRLPMLLRVELHKRLLYNIKNFKTWKF